MTVAELDDWRDRFLAGAEHALRTHPLDDEAQTEQEVKRCKQQGGELVMERDVIKEAVQGHPFGRQMRDE